MQFLCCSITHLSQPTTFQASLSIVIPIFNVASNILFKPGPFTTSSVSMYGATAG